MTEAINSTINIIFSLFSNIVYMISLKVRHKRELHGVKAWVQFLIKSLCCFNLGFSLFNSCSIYFCKFQNIDMYQGTLIPPPFHDGENQQVVNPHAHSIFFAFSSSVCRHANVVSHRPFWKDLSSRGNHQIHLKRHFSDKLIK